VEETNNSDIKFQNTEERQNYIDQRIDLQIKAIGLDEPWYSPKRFTNTVLKVMILDLGRSNYLTSESGSANVRDIILEKMPKTILLFTTSTLIITVIGLYLGAFVANRAGSFWDKFNSAFAVFSSSFPAWWVGMLMIFAFAFTYHIFPAQATPLTAPSDPGYALDLLYHMILPLITIVLEGRRYTTKEDPIFPCLKKCCTADHYCRSLEPLQLVWRCDYCRSSFWLAGNRELILSGNRLFGHTRDNWTDLYIHTNFHHNSISH
jgi:ABC-type microcin C transport system permease subunit YejB